MLRIAHATDIHWTCRPPISSLFGKRLLGSANLYLRGRARHFTRHAQDHLMEALEELSPDMLFLTGDLTAQALPEEFDLAREQLSTLLDSTPTFIMPGNHDAYTHASVRERNMEAVFGDWMHLRNDGIGVFQREGVTAVSLNPCRPTKLDAQGAVPQVQLEHLPEVLAEAPMGDFITLALHYPVVGKHGRPYAHGGHALVNAPKLIQVLNACERRPDMIIHGHIHKGYRSELLLEDGHTIPTFNPGSGGYAYMPKKDRAACFNVYSVEDGQLIGVERYRLGPEGFEPEDGGAYASGR